MVTFAQHVLMDAVLALVIYSVLCVIQGSQSILYQLQVLKSANLVTSPAYPAKVIQINALPVLEDLDLKDGIVLLLITSDLKLS